MNRPSGSVSVKGSVRFNTLGIWWRSKMDLGPIRSVKWSVTMHSNGTLPLLLPPDAPLDADARCVHSLRGRPRHMPLTYGPKCSQFHAVFWKIWQNHMLAPPPTWNPRSAPGSNWFLIQYASICQKKNLNSDAWVWRVTEKLSMVFIFGKFWSFYYHKYL